MKRIYEVSSKVLEYSFYVLLFATPLFWTSFTSEIFELNKMYLTYLLTALITGSWAIKSIASGKFLFKRTFLDIPLALFLLSQVVSYQLSIDHHLSFWGYYSRQNGGLLSTIVYCLLYWAYVSNIATYETRKAIKLLLTSGIIVSIWAILEHFGYSFSCVFLKREFNDDCWVQDVQTRVFASLGQPNWLAAWIVAIMPLSWLLIISDKTQVTRNKLVQLITYYLLPIIFFATLMFTQSRSGFYGFFASYVLFWSGVFWINKFKTNITKPFLLLSGIFLILTIIYGDRVLPQNLQLANILPTSQTTQLTSQTQVAAPPSAGGTESGDIRKIVWKGAVEIWRHYPIFGSGPETFALTYYNFRPQEHNLTSEWNLLYNKAHNEYLNYLANTGIVGLGTYLLLISAFGLYFLSRIFKFQITNLEIALFSGWVSLLITNFFGFSVVVTNTLFFLLPAMALGIVSEKKQETRDKNPKSTFGILGILITLFITCYLVLGVFKLWYSDYKYNQAEKYIKQSWYAHAIYSINDAISLRPDEPLYYDKLAGALAYFAVQQDQAGKKDKAIESANLAEDTEKIALSIEPRSLTLLKSQSLLYLKLSLMDPDYLEKAAPPLEKAIQLAPTDPETFYNLGVIYDSLDEVEKARGIFEKTIELKPNYYDGRIGLAQTYTKLKENDRAREQYQYILDHINPEDEDVKDALKNLPSK